MLATYNAYGSKLDVSFKVDQKFITTSYEFNDSNYDVEDEFGLYLFKARIEIKENCVVIQSNVNKRNKADEVFPIMMAAINTTMQKDVTVNMTDDAGKELYLNMIVSQ